MLIGVDASRITRSRLTGTETYSLHVLRALLALDPSNQYRLYLSKALESDLLPIPCRSRVATRVISLPRLWTHVGLSREMLVSPPEVLYVPSHVLPLVSPARTVVVVYDVGHRFYPEAHGLAERLYLEWAIRRHVRIATEIITISEASKRDLVRLYGARPERVCIAYPAVDRLFVPPTAMEAARVAYKYGLEGPYVLHVGTIKPRKNLPRLLAAFATARLPAGTRLVLAGSAGSGNLAVKVAAVEYGLADRLLQLAYVPQGDLPGLYGGALCTALVSLHEGFGIPALEAMACGSPLVASNVSSLPEFVQSAGLLVDPFDVAAIARGLEQASSDTQLRQHLRAAGPERASSYRWDQAAEITLATIERAGRSPG